MSACESSLRHIFGSNIPDKSSSSPSSSSSSMIDSFSSWNQITALKPPVDHSFTEIFGEFHFKENPNPIPSSNVSEGYTGVQQDDKWGNNNVYQGSYHRKSDSFSSLNSESLQLCTEGLGSESLDDVEDMKIDFPGSWQNHNKSNDNENNNNDENCSHKNFNSFKMGEKMPVRGYTGYQYRKEKMNGKTFPPPISCIGKTVCFQSYRQDGRFVLKEMRIPTHERLHASREDGHLRLCFIQPDEDDASEMVDDGDDGGEDEGGEKGGVEEIDEGEVGKEKVNEEESKEETEVRDEVERGHS